MNKTISFILAVITIVLVTGKVKAAGPEVSFAITPPIIELKANPGDTLQEVISVFNNGSANIKIAATVENLRPSGDVGQVEVVADDNEALPSLKDWIKFADANSFDLQKGETKNVPLTIAVPGNAEPGGHFASVLFGTVNSQSVAGSGSAVSQKIGSLVLLTVAGTTTEKATIQTFSPLKSVYWGNETTKFDLKIQNEGNVYVRPRGFITITNMLGRKVATVETEGKNILPGAIRQIPLEYGHGSLFGRYTATLSLVYGGSNQTLSSAVGFTVIPLKETVIVIIILLVIILLRRRLWRALMVLLGTERRRARKQKKLSQILKSDDSPDQPQ